MPSKSSKRRNNPNAAKRWQAQSKEPRGVEENQEPIKEGFLRRLARAIRTQLQRFIKAVNAAGESFEEFNVADDGTVTTSIKLSQSASTLVMQTLQTVLLLAAAVLTVVAPSSVGYLVPIATVLFSH